MLLMLHLLSAVAAFLVIALITTQFVAYSSFKDNSYVHPTRPTNHPLHKCVLVSLALYHDVQSTKCFINSLDTINDVMFMLDVLL